MNSIFAGGDRPSPLLLVTIHRWPISVAALCSVDRIYCHRLPTDGDRCAGRLCSPLASAPNG
ncbi:MULTISPECIES: hypothetical protein [Cyanophyceae]|uniref:Uncharacterized protein n=1 Tax=Leptolyngbya subtilissima DQ-A4 TaxID=2933933 RepID=A0ABV0K666_9CYAN|nr:hypothetical protein [Nodosilinea sp. FACHB-141]MBD2114487.1 hypothetical protein [Nodosilinea sp. FACHB-141]